MIGQKLGSFLIEAELGSGAMGIVYRGVRETGKTRVAAVKVIANDQLAKGKAYERFIREAEILEQFRHPNIVRYLARGKQGKIFYYAMEFVPGTTLDAVLEERGALPWDEVARIGAQVCEALHYAHEHGVVHRDLKPSNLMMTKDGQVKLTDFGIAKDLDATALTATGRTLGTAAYMAPEQIRGTPEVSHKTDLYALGILFYQMLTGELPFAGGSAVVLMHLHMTEPPRRPSDKTALIPVALDELVLKLMGKIPGDRPWDAAAVGVTLRELLDDQEAKRPIPMVWPEEGSATAVPTRTMDAPRPLKKKKKKKGSPAARLAAILPTAGLVAALVAVGGLIGYILWPPSAPYLFAQAEPLMNAPERASWALAEPYLEELDRRFPDHPFKAQTDAWHAKIALASAGTRAEVIETSSINAYRKLQGPGEEMFGAVYPEANAAIKRNDEADAARRYREMAEKLAKEPSRATLGWQLLAARRADAIEAAIRARAVEVAGLIDQAEAWDRKGLPDQALKVRRDLLDRFGKYSDTAEILAPVRLLVPDPGPPKPPGAGSPAP